MPSIALIAEGITDHIVLTRLIHAIYKDKDGGDDVQINPLQPIHDATDAHHAPHAGWEKVFEFCEYSIEDALATNDYIVIHIDTDEGDHVNFGLGLTENGVDRSYLDLIEHTKAILISKMGSAASETALRRIAFAIAVHATESWILLIVFKENKLKSAFARLSHLLRQRHDLSIKKEARAYSNLARSMKNKDILLQHQGEHSLGVFMRAFDDIIELDLDHGGADLNNSVHANGDAA